MPTDAQVANGPKIVALKEALLNAEKATLRGEILPEEKAPKKKTKAVK